MLRHIAKEHKHIHAGQLRQTKRYGPMDDHVQRKPRFLDSYMRWMIATYQPIDTCEHPKFRAMVEAAAGNAKDIQWFGAIGVVQRMREMVIWTEDKLPGVSYLVLPHNKLLIHNACSGNHTNKCFVTVADVRGRDGRCYY